jgi:GTPase
MEQGKRVKNNTVVRERAMLVGCLFPNSKANKQDPLDELRNLAHAVDAIVVDEVIQNRVKPDPATFIGSGKVDELAERAKAQNVDVIIFDNDLSPTHIGNIEEITNCKVLDRSELILDIFASRARTTEARLQVELAQLEYTYPRLRAMWSHLERITGGAPTGIGTRGPGEQQLEIDRRIVQKKLTALKRELKVVQARKQREVEKRNQDFFTVGLVGYTNAGKSTFFNTATGAEAFAHDMLFATLSTQTRRWELGGGDSVMLSDTVGFVRDLPHHLVASFKATLEEAVHADMLLIVLDISDPQHRQQYETVVHVLDEVGAEDPERLLVLNKVDLLENNADLLVMQQEHPDAIAVSAKTGRGMDRLVDRITAAARGRSRQVTLSLPMTEGKAIHFLESQTQVLSRSWQENVALFTVRIGATQLQRLMAMGVGAEVVEQPAK